MRDAGNRPDAPHPAFFDLTVTGKLKPVIAERFPLLEAARAHEFIERGGYAGKAVLTVG